MTRRGQGCLERASDTRCLYSCASIGLISLTAFFDVRVSAGRTGNSLSSAKSYCLSPSTNVRGHKSVQSANDRRARYAGHLLVDRASPNVRLESRHEYRANTAALTTFSLSIIGERAMRWAGGNNNTPCPIPKIMPAFFTAASI